MKNLLVAQSGGPTAAINSTLVGVITFVLTQKDKIEKIYGAINGIEGVFKEKIINLNDNINDTEDLYILENTPASALGSCRYKLEDKEEKIENIIKIFRKYNIGYFIYIGGNDSMDTVYKISEYIKKKNILDIKVVGAPKTIDNDLDKIDHCPGFGSAAKYVGITFSEIERDINVYDTKSVTIVEVMGRNVGWLTAASILSKENGNGPDLVYLCEKEFSTKKFIEDIKVSFENKKNLLIAISEGIKNKEGLYISEEVQISTVDSFGHKYISGAGKVLEELIRNEIGCKVRSIELNIMQRCSGHILSKVDIEESKLLGMKACQCAIDGKSGVMAIINRINNSPYEIDLSYIDISKVANIEKKVPLEWINKEGNGLEKEMIEYLLPLVQGEVKVEYKNGLPKHMILY